MTQRDDRFASRLGLLLSMLGIAVGTGNIWRFPRIVAQNSGDGGSGAFLIVWLCFLFAWSIPLIVAEYAMGKAGRLGVVGTFAHIAGRRLGWLGGFVGVVATAIMFYYSVVTGWCFYYFFLSILRPLPDTTAGATAMWESFHVSGAPVLFHALAMGLGAAVIWRGVRSIERMSKVLLPTLFAIVIVAVIRAVTLDGAGSGIRFLFTPDWRTLGDPSTWLEALTQNAWDTGAGWGLILTYGAYMQRSHGIVKNAFITGIGNNTVSLLAAIMVCSTVFAILGAEMSRAEVLAVMRDSGPASTGLTFIWMPQLFARMPLGSIVGSLFFLGLSFAAFTSLVSMIEMAARVVVDIGVPRERAVVMVSVAGFILGLPSAFNLDFLGNQDFVWGVGLMISGAFVAAAILIYGVPRFRSVAVEGSPGDWRAGRIWDLLIGLLVPLEAAILLAWWMYLSAAEYAPESWYDPFEPYSVMTCLAQWGLALVLLLLLNRWLVVRTLAPRGWIDPGS
ncbi:MAG TPA: sodium-dependent transporter [Rhodothermales bacterium]